MNPDPNVIASMIFAFSITTVAIASKIVREWLQRRDQRKAALGAAKLELDRKVERLEQANAEMARRLENLETIVVSQAWSTVAAPGATEAERPPRLAAALPHQVYAPASEEANRQRAEQLARRLGG